MKKTIQTFFILFLYIKSYSQTSGPDSGRNLLYNSDPNPNIEARVNITDALTFDHPSNNISLESWIFPTASTNGCVITKHETNFTREYDLKIYSDGRIRFALFSNTDVFYLTNSTTTIPLNQWTHIAATYNSTLGIAKIYINGIEDVSNSIGTITIASSNTNILIGAYWLNNNTNSRDHFNGYIDEVRLWHSTRTETEIKDNMCRSLSTPQINLIAYYKFDETSGLIANDASGNNNNGTLQNFQSSQTNSWPYSGAPIGNASTHQYTSSWTGVTISLNSTSLPVNRGSLTLDNITGAPTGVHLFRVNSFPSQSGGLTNAAATYYGTFITGGTINYRASYNYTGSVYDGQICESSYRLAQRTDNSIANWADISATPNTSTNLIRATGLTSRTEIILHRTCTALPLEFFSFDVSRNSSNHIVLEWSTINEKNTYNFIIEKSTNAKDFTPIGEVKASNIFSLTNLYTFTDPEYLTGTSYYRIRQNDIDGEFSYSSIKTMAKENKYQYDIFPNPANDNISIKASTDCIIKITDALSKSIGEYTYLSNDIFNLSLADLSPGIYFITFLNSESNFTKRIILNK